MEPGLLRKADNKKAPVGTIRNKEVIKELMESYFDGHEVKFKPTSEILWELLIWVTRG